MNFRLAVGTLHQKRRWNYALQAPSQISYIRYSSFGIVIKKTPNGPQKILNMRADLVGFHHMPGNHTGKHLAHAFLFITDRLDITEKVSSLLFVLIFLILACQDWVDYYGQCIKQ
jgi:hypothetical protein